MQHKIIIVLAVMLFFLGLRTGFIIASLIPIVTITTFMVMGLFGIGLNQITLAALIMALGMMVDNAIVVAIIARPDFLNNPPKCECFVFFIVYISFVINLVFQ